jgi:hypothetical protein
MADKSSSLDNLTFVDKQSKQTLESHKYILNEYRKSIESVTKLEGNLPIFLDTSVILSLYEISFIARTKIKQFLRNNKNRIVLTGQVQFEFIKNREKVINSFREDVTERLPKDFNGNVISKLNAFVNDNKIKLEDYPKIQEKLLNVQSVLSELLKEIQENVNDKKGIAASLLYEDDSLTILSEAKLLTTLEESYIKIIKEDYKKLLPLFKSKPNELYTLSSFPGCGEKGEKDNPEGDFIIYHELLKYAADNKTNVVFLTNDTSKGDWLRKDGKPHLHYIENFYLNTGFILFVLNAERLFETLFETSFESLIEDRIDEPNMIKHHELETFLRDVECLKNFKMPDEGAINVLAKQLYRNGIYSISALNKKLKYAAIAVPEIRAFIPSVTKAGAVKICLDLLDPTYERSPWNASSEMKIAKLTAHWDNEFSYMF